MISGQEKASWDKSEINQVRTQLHRNAEGKVCEQVRHEWFFVVVFFFFHRLSQTICKDSDDSLRHVLTCAQRLR